MNQPVKTSHDLGQIIRQKRKSQHLTQVQVAEHCGLSPRFISEIERAKSTAEIGKALYLLEALGIDLLANTRNRETLV